VFTITVAAMLAIGIGANGVVMTVVDRMFFRKLPVPNPERVFEVFGGDTRDGVRRRVSGPVSFPVARDLATRLDGVEGVAAYSMAGLDLGGPLAGNEVYAAFVTGNYFTVLGAKPTKGRWIVPGEDAAEGSHPVVVISETFWRLRFDGDPNVVGSELEIGRGRFTIVGVMPKGFTGTQPEGRTDVWLPYTMQAAATGRAFTFSTRELRKAIVVARLTPGGSVPRVQARLDAILPELAAIHPETDGSLRLRASLHDRLFTQDQNPGALPIFLLVWVMVALVHLVACSNVSSLVLARLAARRRELGVRLCLGASRRRIVLESLAEPLLLAVVGAAGGIAIARVLTVAVTGMQFLSAADPGLDWRVVGTVAVLTLVTALAFGLAPALDTSRRDPLSIIRGSPGSLRGGARDWNGPFLVGSQVALSVVLLANATALVRMFGEQATRDPGFDASRTVMAEVRWRTGAPLPADWSPIVDQFVSRVNALPGVGTAVLAEGAPLFRPTRQEVVVVPGYDYRAGEARNVSVQLVGPGYFATVGARVAAGREFDSADALVPGAPSGVVVNEAFAERYLPGRDPIGAELLYRGTQRATVVGVVRGLRDISLNAVIPRAYLPIGSSRPLVRFNVVVRASGDPRIALASLHQAIVSSPLPIELPYVRPMTEIVDDALATPRVGGIAMSVCAGIALLLTALGLYGLVAMWSASRRAEIGIRIALGARSRHVHALLLGRVGRLFAIGAGVGILGGVYLVRMEQGWWGPAIKVDALPVVASLGILALVAGLAAWIPSLRASRLDPAETLRSA
jgi:predicted permease